MKLHLGCGTVYLKNYINIDAQGVWAKERPDIRKHNETTIDKYFKHPFRSNINNECFDIRADITDLSMFEDNSVDEVFSANVIEHLQKDVLLKAIEKHWHRVLKPGGLLIIGVPDIVGIAKELLKAKDWKYFEEVLNWIYCHHRTKFDTHLWGYSPEYLTHLVEPLGFKFFVRNDKYINKEEPYPFLLQMYKAVK